MTFNEHDVWHQNAHLLFGFQCHNCEAMIGYGDVDIDPNRDFLQFCIEVTEEAKKRKWVCAAPFEFYCQDCASTNALNNQ